MLYACFLLFLASVAGNAFLAFRLKQLKTTPEKSYDARMLLRDLASGDALIKVTRIAPEEIFLRSPRGAE